MRKKGITGLVRAIMLAIGMCLSGTLHTKGQDVSFSQFYANPLYLNPAFTGSAGAPRIAMQYRDQWHQLDGAYSSYAAAADMPVKKLRGGLGLYLLNDAQANQALNSFQLTATYAVQIQLSRDYFFNGGIQFGYAENSLKTNNLIFADNLENNSGIPGTSAEVFSDNRFSYLDYGFGLIVYSKRVFGGLSVQHLTEPDLSFSDNPEYDSRLPRKYNLHAGAHLPVFRHGHLRKKFDISPQLILQKQGIYEQINYGMFATCRGLTGGAWLRQNFGLRYDSVILLAGYVNSWMQLTYSYDWTISGLAGESGGTSEISIAFILKKRSGPSWLPFFDPYEEQFGEP